MSENGDQTIMPGQPLPGRNSPLVVNGRHRVLGTPLTPPFPDVMQQAIFGMGCFWGAERCFWECPGVYTTAVGYSAGHTPHPRYEEVCSGTTGHSEVVLVVYDPRRLDYEALLRIFWESHDPTQGMRQGNDVGSQYRSGIYFFTTRQKAQACASRGRYQRALHAAGRGDITSEILAAGDFYYAEACHQQYLARNPGGYCGLGGSGVPLPDPGQDSGDN